MARRLGRRSGGHHGGGAERATELRRLRSAREKAARHARGLLRRGPSWRPPRRLRGKQPLGMPVGAAVAARAAARALQAAAPAEAVQY